MSSRLLRNLNLAECASPIEHPAEPGEKAAENRIQNVVHQVRIVAALAIQVKPLAPPASADTAPPFILIHGCGILGASVAEALLSAGWPPAMIGITSRNASSYHCFSMRGVQCSEDPMTFLRWTAGPRLLVLCIPHAQLRAACSTIRNAPSLRSSNCIVLSAVLGVTRQKLQQLLPDSQVQLRVTPIDSDSDSGTRPAAGSLEHGVSALLRGQVGSLVDTLAQFFEVPATTDRAQAKQHVFRCLFGRQYDIPHVGKEASRVDNDNRADKNKRAAQSESASSSASSASPHHAFEANEDAQAQWQERVSQAREEYFALVSKVAKQQMETTLTSIHPLSSKHVLLMDVI